MPQLAREPQHVKGDYSVPLGTSRPMQCSPIEPAEIIAKVPVFMTTSSHARNTALQDTSGDTHLDET